VTGAGITVLEVISLFVVEFLEALLCNPP